MTLSKRFLSLLLLIPGLLLIPFLAMQFSQEVNWSVWDFLVMGTLLLFLVIAIEILIKCVKQKKTRIGLIIAAVVAFLLVWAELSVGVLGAFFAESWI